MEYTEVIELALNKLGMNGKMIKDKLNEYEEYKAIRLTPEEIKVRLELADRYEDLCK